MTRSTFVVPRLVVSIFVLFVLSSPVNAAVFCVDSASALQSALTTAQSNGEDDQIQIVQGTYVGNFVYASTQANDLAVQGGWATGCASREIDPANTVLDGDQTGAVLVLSSNVSMEFLLQGATLRTVNPGNYYEGFFAQVGDGGTVTVASSIIDGNMSGGGIYISAPSGNVVLTDNGIQHSIGDGVRVDAESGIVTFANNNSSFNAGRGANISAKSGTVTLTENSIRNNNSGGSIVYAGNVVFTNNIIQNNSNDISGGYPGFGGVYIGDMYNCREDLVHNANFTGNNIRDNVGSGIDLGCSSGIVTLDRNNISANTGSGAGISNSTGSVTLTNNNIEANKEAGANIYSSTVTLSENNIAGNKRGGVGVSGSTITFTSNNILDNQGGVGASVVGRSIALVYNNIERNTGYYSGGLSASSAAEGSSATFARNNIKGNTAPYRDEVQFIGGGGVYVGRNYNEEFETVTFMFNDIETNTAGYGGGGIDVSANNIDFNNNNIRGNTAAFGGGVYIRSHDPNGAVKFTNNNIHGNSANDGGGGVYFSGVSGHTLFANNVIQENTSSYGGGAYFPGWAVGTINLINNSIHNNRARSSDEGGGKGGGLYLTLGSDETSPSVALYNNVFWRNVADWTEGAGSDLWIDNDLNGDFIPTPMILLNNNFDQTQGSGYYTKRPTSIDPSNFNSLNTDPLFVDAENGDLRLLPDSPMIDAGHLGVSDLPEFDIAGTPRVLGESVDIGAYEFDDGSDPRGILFVASDGTGTGTVTSDPEGIDCGTDCAHAFVLNTPVTLTGTPDGNSVFDGWSGDPDCLDGQLVMDGNRACTATFNAVRQLTTTKAGEGDGTITSTPAGIDCGSACSAFFYLDESVVLTATPDAQSLFTGWSGDPMCPSPLLDQDRACTATFDPILYRLFVVIGGEGTGTVASDPEGIDCGLGCEADFKAGTEVTLTASAADGSIFDQWAGACSGTDPTCRVTLSASRAATALFASAGAEYPLTVVPTGTGTGTVTSTPAGIDCGSDCAEDYPAGERVRLTADPADGSTFAGWGGDCTGTLLACEVTLDAARTVVADFDLAGGSTCPAEATVAAQADRAGWLTLLDGVRDSVLAQSAQGRALIGLYYRHGEEVSTRLTREPRLALQAFGLMRLLRADLEAATAGRRPDLDGRERAAIRAFATRLRSGASPALAEALDGFLARDLDAVLGITRH